VFEEGDGEGKIRARREEKMRVFTALTLKLEMSLRWPLQFLNSR